MFADTAPSNPGSRAEYDRRPTDPWMSAGRPMPAASASSMGIADYWRLALKHRLVILGSLIAAILAGALLTLLMTPIYTANTTLQIEREAVRVFNVDDGQPRETGVQSEEFFQTQYGLLRSRVLAERVIDTLGLASSDTFIEAMGGDVPQAEGATARDQQVARRREVLKLLSDNLNVVPVRGSRLVSVQFDSPDPALSARIANTFATNFIQMNLERKYESSSYAREFLEDRIAQTKARLEEAERGLVAYATAEQLINVSEPDENGNAQPLSTQNLVSLNTELAEARATRIAAEEKWRQASSASVMSLPEVFQNPAVQRLTEERARLQAEYQQKTGIFQPDYPEMVQLRARIDELESQINAVTAGIRNSIRGQYQVAANEERSLAAAVEGLKAEVLDVRDRSVQYNILQREVDTSRTLYDGLLQRYKEVGVMAGVSTNNISIVDQAQPPVRPSKPNLLMNLAIAALLGLGLGLVIAFVLDALDQSLATPDAVESKLGIPVLGVIPLLGKDEVPSAALQDSKSPFAESYHSLRTAVQFSTPDGAPRTLLVTSARPAEGKTTTAFAMAQSLAGLGKKVLLIDGDLRNPSMHRSMGVRNDNGMSNLLSGGMTLATVTHPTPKPNLDFIPSGPLPPNPAELWAGDRLRQVLAEAGATYDHIVIDGPPVLGFADAPMLAATVGGTLFVLDAKGARRAQVRGALNRLQMGQSHVLGTVLTKFNPKSSQFGGYDYAYDYEYGAGSRGHTPQKQGPSEHG